MNHCFVAAILQDFSIDCRLRRCGVACFYKINKHAKEQITCSTRRYRMQYYYCYRMQSIAESNGGGQNEVIRSYQVDYFLDDQSHASMDRVPGTGNGSRLLVVTSVREQCSKQTIFGLGRMDTCQSSTTIRADWTNAI